MSIKGCGQTLFVGKKSVTIKEPLERDKIFKYNDIRAIDYQYSEKSNYGFLRFKLTNGPIHTFSFKERANEPISRAIQFIKERESEIPLTERSEKFGAKEKFALLSIKKKIFPFALSFLIIFLSIYISMSALYTGTDSNMYITLEEYNKCKTGMTYEECIKIIGSEGTPLAETNISDVNTTAYIWYGDSLNRANANLYFMDGKLYSKAQYGLK